MYNKYLGSISGEVWLYVINMFFHVMKCKFLCLRFFLISIIFLNKCYIWHMFIVSNILVCVFCLKDTLKDFLEKRDKHELITQKSHDLISIIEKMVCHLLVYLFHYVLLSVLN